MKVVIALATRGRPKVLKQTVEATLANIGRHNTEMHVCMDEDDFASIDAVSSISSGHLFPDVRPREDSLGGKYNRVIGRGDIYMVMVDYAPHLTKGFDNLLVRAAQCYKDGICFLYGPLANMSFPSMQAVTHRTAELMGRIYPEDYAFWFVDHDLHEIARMTGRIAHVPLSVDYVTHRQGTTTECRDVRFWTIFFDAMAGERQSIARKLIEHMDIPDWLKLALQLKFPIVEQYSTIMHNGVRMSIPQIEFDRGDPRPRDDRYNRILERAKAKLEQAQRARAA
jgi:hypothetical protein